MVCWVIGEIGSQTYEENPQKLNDMTVAVSATLNTMFENELTIRLKIIHL
jgi:AP-4 complex subunit epsilon-1